MNLNHLNIFRAVADQGSISRGADRLKISQPAVSKQLAEFERAVGEPLFDRLPKGVRLTPAGVLLEEYAQRLFAIEAEAEKALRELRGVERGQLTIGASTSIGAYLLPSVLVAFHRTYPRIEIQMEIGNTRTIHRAVAAGMLDIGFTEGLIDNEDVDATVFREDDLVPIAAPGYTGLSLGDTRDVSPLTLARFCEEPFLVREEGSGTREVIEEALRRRGMTVRPIMTLGNTEAIKKAVSEQVGVAIVSALTIQREVADGRLVILHLDDFSLRRPLHRLRSRSRHESPALRAFLRMPLD